MKNEITMKMWIFILSICVSFFLGSFGQYKNQSKYIKMIDSQFETMEKMQEVNNKCVKQVAECVNKLR